MKKPLTYISLFSSAGVGCYGFKQHGFECIATNEILKKRLKLQVYNSKCKYESGYIPGDISSPEVKDLLNSEIRFWQGKYKISEPDVIIATPPCQGMSVANHKKSDEIGRNSLVIESIKITNEVNPKFFVFENVRSFLSTLCTDVDNTEKTIGDAINYNLGGKYNILSQIVNFKDYGANSSRTRTLVVGVRKDLINISPYDIFPKQIKPKTLRQLFSDLPVLNKMGEISENDIYHGFREYDSRMIPWVENLVEGQSAFENEEAIRIPHQVKDGVIIFNQSKNGDKYARWFWDKEGPCIHTRNDIFASQNTIHPSENRVFSIRELMRMMNIPDNFKWSNKDLDHMNQLSLLEKRKFLKDEELNIRHCIGEAVPTGVFSNIASRIKKAINQKHLTTGDINKIISEHNLSIPSNLVNFIHRTYNSFGIDNICQIAELANASRQDNAAYFTRKDIVYTVIKDLPDFKSRKNIRILEPSVGVGNFIPLIIEKYRAKQKVIVDLVDIDNNSLNVLSAILSHIEVPENFTFNLINSDFLTYNFKHKYDLVVGNPPYKKLSGSRQLVKYKSKVKNTDTNNLFAFFIEKSISIGAWVSLIVPKSLINAPEFNLTRALINDNNLVKICDYGEKAFKGVKIETISFLVEAKGRKHDSQIVIESYINNSIQQKPAEYVLSPEYPYWLLYRDKTFDDIASKLKLNVFQSFRDRQITKTITKDKGAIRVLKSRNIGNNEIHQLKDYDCYIDTLDNLSVSKYLNRDAVVLIPNLTYNPRATFLPKNTIADGSVALLTLRNGSRLPNEDDLRYYSTKEFEYFYRVARNLGTRSLNIDNNSVFFFGLLKED